MEPSQKDPAEGSQSSISRMGSLSASNSRSDIRSYFPFFALFESPAPKPLVQLGTFVDLLQLLALIVNRLQPFGGILRAIALPVYFSILPFWDQQYAVQVGYDMYQVFVWVSLIALAALVTLCGTVLYAVFDQHEKRGLTLTKLLMGTITTFLFQPMLHVFLAYSVCTSGGSGQVSSYPTQNCVHTSSMGQLILFVVSIVGLVVLCFFKFVSILLNYDDLPTTSALRGRSHNVCEVAFVTLQIVAAVLFHYQPAIGQRQAFAGIFALGTLIVAVLHAFYLPFFNMAMNSTRTACLLGITYVATVVTIFYHNNTAEAATSAKNWSSLVLIGGFLLSALLGYVVSRVRLGGRCQKALAAAAIGRKSSPREGAVFPAYLPVEEVVKHRDLEAIILGEVKFHRAQQSLTGPQREREENRDELWIAEPYIEYIFTETDIELAVRHLREFRIVTALQLPPFMISYALRVYSKGLARFSASSWLHVQFAAFLCTYSPSRNHVALQLCDHVGRDGSVDTLTLYRSSRRAASIAASMMIRDSTSKKSFQAAQQLHKDALHHMKLFWSKLLQDQVDVTHLGALAKIITDRREEGLWAYERIVGETTDNTTIVKYAQFLEQVMMDPEAATSARDTVLDVLEQEQLGVTSKDTAAGRINIKGRDSSSSVNRSVTVENLNFNINFTFGILFLVVIGLFVFGFIMWEERKLQVTKLHDAGSARSHLAIMLYHTNMLADAVWMQLGTSVIAAQLAARLIGFRELQNALTVGVAASKTPEVMELFSQPAGRVRHDASHVHAGLWELGQYVASAVETILDAETSSSLSERNVAFVRDNAVHAAVMYNRSLTIYIGEAETQLAAGISFMVVFYAVALLVLGAVYTVLIYNFKLIGTSKLSTLSLFTLIPKNALDKLMAEGSDRIKNFDQPCDVFQKLKVQRGLEDDADAMDQVVRELDDDDTADATEERRRSELGSKKSVDEDTIELPTSGRFASLAKNSSVADTGKVKPVLQGLFETPYAKDQFLPIIETQEMQKERKKELNDEKVEEDLRVLRLAGRGDDIPRGDGDGDLGSGGSSGSGASKDSATKAARGSREVEESRRQVFATLGMILCVIFCIAFGGLAVRQMTVENEAFTLVTKAPYHLNALFALEERVWYRQLILGVLVFTRSQGMYDRFLQETNRLGFEDLVHETLPHNNVPVADAMHEFEDAWREMDRLQLAVVRLVCAGASLNCPHVQTFTWTDDIFASTETHPYDTFSILSSAPPKSSPVELANAVSSAAKQRSAESVFVSSLFAAARDRGLRAIDSAARRIEVSLPLVEEAEATVVSCRKALIALAVLALLSSLFSMANTHGRAFETPLIRVFLVSVSMLCVAMLIVVSTRIAGHVYHGMPHDHEYSIIVRTSANDANRGVYRVIENAERLVIAGDPVAAVWLDADNGGDLFRAAWRLLSPIASAAATEPLGRVYHNCRTVINTALIASTLAAEAKGMYLPPYLAKLTWNFTNDLLASRLALEFPTQVFFTSRAEDTLLPNATKLGLAVNLLIGPWLQSSLFEGVALMYEVGQATLRMYKAKHDESHATSTVTNTANIGIAFACVGLNLLVLFLVFQFALNQISASRFGEARKDELFMKLTQRSRIVLVLMAVFFTVLFAVTISEFEASRSSALGMNLASMREFDVANGMITGEQLINSSWQRASQSLYSDPWYTPQYHTTFTINDKLGTSLSNHRTCNVSTTTLRVSDRPIEVILRRGTNLAQRRWKDEMRLLNTVEAPAATANVVRLLEKDMLPLFVALETSTANYAKKLKEDLTSSQVIFFLITAATALLIVICFFFVFRPTIVLLLNEEEGTKVMLKMIPVEVRESVPAIAEYLETGVVMQDMKVQEINEAASDLSTVPTVTIDTKGFIVKFSRAAEDAFLWTKQEAVGQKIQILMPENIAAEHDSYLATYRRTGVKKIIGMPRKVRAKRKDGTLFPAEVSVQEFRNGRNTTFTGTLQNISVEIEFERAIALSTAVSEAATVPIVVINAKGVIQRFNSAAEETFKCSQADVVGRKVNVLMPQAEADLHDTFLDRYAKTGVKNVIDTRRRGRGKKLTGELFPVQLYIRELKRGKESLFIGYIEDMTKQVHLQMASMVSDAIMATSPVPLISIDESGLVLSWSPAATIAFGYNAHDVIQRNIKFLMPDNIAYRHDSFLQQYGKTKRKKMIGNTTLVKAKRREDDGTFTMIPVKVAIRDITEQGKGNRFVAFLQDVSSQLILEREYKISSSITNLSSTPLITIDEKGTCTAFSAAAEVFFGYTKAEMINTNIEILCPQSIRSLHDGFLQRYLSTGVKTVIDKTRAITACHKDGRDLSIEINVKEVKFQGKSNFVAHIKPVHELVKMQEANAYNDAISNLTTTPIIVMSMEGIILNCSEVTCERFAWSKDELVGQNIGVLMPDHVASKHDGYLQAYKTRLASNGVLAARKTSTILHQERRIIARTRDEQQFSASVHVRDLHIDGMPPIFVGYIRDTTEEIQLAVQRTIAESIIQLSSIPLICIDRLGIIREFSQSAQKDFLYSREEVVGKNIKMLMPDDIAVRHDGYLRSYTKTGVKNIIDSKRQIQGKKKNGRLFSLEIAVKEVIVQDTQGKETTEYVGFLRDLTQQYILQQAQLINEVVMELATVPIIVINSRGTVIDFNAASEREFGWLKTDIISRNVKLLMPDAVAVNHDGYLSSYKITKKKVIIDGTRLVMGKRKDGVLFPCEVSVREVIKSGAEAQYIGYVRNVSSTQLLATQYKVNSTIIELAATPLVVIDSMGTISITNSATEQTFGYQVGELRGKNIKILMPSSIANQHDQYLATYRETGVKNIVDSSRRVLAQTKRGKQFPVEVSVKEIQDSDGHSMFIGYILNCTEESIARAQVEFGECINLVSPTPIISIDHLGTVRIFSVAAEAEFGYSAAEVVGNNIKMLQPDNVAAVHDGYLSRYLATGVKKVIDQEKQVMAKRADGVLFNAAITVREMRVNASELPIYVGYLRNVDQELKNLESFREGSAMMGLSPIPVIVLSLKGIIVDVNKATETTFGFTTEEMVGQNVKMLMPENIAVNHDGYLANYIQTRVKSVIDTIRHVSAVKKNGYKFQCEISVREIAIEGIETQYIGYIRDITEALKMKEAATVNEAVTSVSTSPLLVIDPVGLILKFSGAAEELFGYSQEEIAGQNVRKLMPPKVAAEHDGYLERYLSTGIKKVIDRTTTVSARKKNGEIFPCEIGVREVKNNDGTTAVFIGFIRSLDQAMMKVGQSSEVNSMMIDLASQAMVIIDTKGTIERTNDPFNACFNVAAGMSLVGGNIKSIMPDATAAQHDQYLANYVSMGVKKIIGTKQELIGKDMQTGKPIHVEVNVREIIEPDKPTRYLGYIRRLDKDLEMRVVKKISAAAMDLTSYGTIVIDILGKILMFSSAAEAIFEAKASEVIGTNIKSLMPPDVSSRHDEYLSNYNRTGEKHVIDTTKAVVAKTVHSHRLINITINIRELKFSVQGLENVFVGYVELQK